jgi:hypothetical protein
MRKGERQLRCEQREREGLLPDIKDRLTNRYRLCGFENHLTNRCRLCGCVGHNSLACVEPAQMPCVP